MSLTDKHNLDLFYYILYDASLFLAAFTLLANLVTVQKPVPHPGRFWTGVLAVKLVAASLIPMVLSFAGLHQASIYLTVAALISGSCVYAIRRRSNGDFASGTFIRELFVSPFSVLLFAGSVLVFLPPLLATMAPPSETDTLVNLSKLLEWVQYHKTPYHFAYNYVSFAEAAYVPVVVVARQDTVLWLPSVQAVLVFALAAYQLARLVLSSKLLAFVLALNGTALVHFWYGVSGVATIKNDMLYNAGLLLVVLSSLADFAAGQKILSRVFFICGFIFASVKYSGPVFLAGMIAILFVAYRHEWKRYLRFFVTWTAVTFLATTGHFYIKNLVRYGNPLFPMKLSVFGFSLPGTMDFQGTSILSNWRHPETWTGLLGTLKEGPLFPIAFVGFLYFLPIVFVSRREKELGRGLRLLAASCLLAWLVYFASQWSAGMAPGDVGMVTAHYSFRYASAADVLAKILFGACLIRFVPRTFWVVFGLFAGDLIFRLFHLYSVPIQFVPLWRAMGWSVAGLCLIAVAMFFLRSRARVALAGIIPVALVAASPGVGEINRSRWWINEFKPVTDRLRNAAGSDVVVLNDPALWPLMYPASGQFFQHRILIQDQRTLLAKPGDCRTNPDAIVLFSTHMIPDELVDTLSPALNACGLPLMGRSVYSAIFLTDKGSKVLPPGSVAASFVPDSELDEIASGKRKSPGSPLLTISGDRPVLMMSSSFGYRAVAGTASSRVKVVNLGGQLDHGGFSSLDFRWSPGGWRISEESLGGVISQFTLSSILENGKANPSWVIGGGGKVAIEVAGSPGHEVLRLRAGADIPWMAVLFSGSTKIRNAAVTLFGEVRSVSQGPFTLTAASGGKYLQILKVSAPQSWTRLAVSQQFDTSATGFQLGAGLGSVKSGDLLEIRSLRILQAKLPSEAGGLYQADEHE